MSDPSAQLGPSVLLIGGPDAGKSNFLFRLWLAVDSGNASLKKNGFPDELEYLRTGLESLLRGDFAGRTSKEVLEHVTIPLRSALTLGHVGILNVPDVPGETILQVYKLRHWSALWEDRVREGCGCLIFIRAASEEVVRPLDYTECLATFGATLPASEIAQNADGLPLKSNPDERPDVPSQTKAPEPPTEVVLTDWLQFLRRAYTERVRGTYRPRIGIVIAAWDAVPADAQNRLPIEYLEENFPLLRQFIETNDERFNFQVFGLSILGGDLKNDIAFKQQFQQGNPDSFGFVIHSISGVSKREADVTIPVAWALGWLPLSPELEAAS